MVECKDLKIENMIGEIQFENIDDVYQQINCNIKQFKENGVEFINIINDESDLYWFRVNGEKVKLVDVKPGTHLKNVCKLIKKP